MLMRSLVVGAACLASSMAIAGPPSAQHPVFEPAAGDTVLNEVLVPLVTEQFGLGRADIVTLPLDRTPGMPVSITIPINGEMIDVSLVTHSVRSPEHYEVLAADAMGNLKPVAASPVRTLRGAAPAIPGSRAAGSMLESGLMMRLDLPDGSVHWLEPLERVIDGLTDRYVIYEQGDVLDHGGTCGLEQQPMGKVVHDLEIGGGGGLGPIQGSNCIAELGCDADTEFYNDYGTVAATEAQINAIINTVNQQYESQVSITHQITTIIVRTSTDPYTASDPVDRLCQFILEWTNNQQGIQRDVAHLFTGVNLDGSVIGIASDIGQTGICVNQGSCTGGQFGTQGSYCLSQSDFNGNFSCATDLTAHELGHLWGAFHCSCSGNTMNSSITCANSFSGGTINSIIAYRDTRTCLSGSCDGGPSGPDNDSCDTPESIPANTSFTLNNSTATPFQGQSDPELPNGSPSCQWQGTPSNTHSTLWYEFVATDTSVEVRTCDTTAIQDTIIALYSGNCNNLNELACGEDDCGSTTYMSSLCYDGLTPGNTYRVMVGNPGGWSGSTPGTIEFEIACPCPSIGPSTGSCCLTDGTCVESLTSTQCNSQGGTFQGTGSDCTPNPCSPQTGACCFSNGSCSELSNAQCTSAGGTYQGNNSDCTPNNCPQPEGACCFGNGSCSVLSSDDCSSSGGFYQGDGTDCSPSPCQPITGACCFPNGACSVQTESNCDGFGGTYFGNGTDCAPNPCPQPEGACCLPNDSCTIETSLDCGALGGIFNGTDTTCFDGDGDGVADFCDGCPNDPDKTEPGDCGCGTPDDDSDGDGTPDCDDGCPFDPDKTEPGDCGCGVADIDSDGDGTPDCNDGCPFDPDKTEPGECGCGTADDDSDGDGTPDCDDNCPNTFNPGQEDCDQDGTGNACSGEPDCNSNGIPDSCDIADGVSEDANQNGVPDECEKAPCLGDIDGSGQVEFNDLVLLLSAWGPCGGCPSDLDGNGQVEFNDLVLLLSLWGPCE